MGYDFDCQHGPPECLGNTIHACAVQYVRNQDLVNEYIGCMMDNNRDLKEAGQKCAEKLGNIDWPSISTCAEGAEGGKLLAHHGDDTHSLKPSVTFIPTAQLNGSQDGQKLMLKDLKRAICNVLEGKIPEACL